MCSSRLPCLSSTQHVRGWRKAIAIAQSDMADWVPFHQQEALTTRLANILEEYPVGVGSLREFVQNADDAGAVGEEEARRHSVEGHVDVGAWLTSDVDGGHYSGNGLGGKTS
mgnify:CR=1 FL=1